MGCCSDCAYFYKESGLIFDRYACSKFGRYVRANDSCDAFIAKPSGGGGCFLTSACTEFMGKPDDCEELTKLRAFRDNFMKSSESGRKLVEEYYRIAPEIVKKINASENKNIYYDDIYQTILKCLPAIDSGNNGEALILYKQMVDKYRKQFSI